MSSNLNSPSTQNSGSEPTTFSLKTTFELIGKVIAPSTILTVLLFYYGWVRTNALFYYFGIDQTVLGFSIQDYLLRSITVVFEPLRWILILLLAGLWGHVWISRLITAQPEAKVSWFVGCLPRLILAFGLLLVLSSEAAVWLNPQFEFLLYPLIWTIGVSLTSCGFYLFIQLRGTRNGAEKRTSQMPVASPGVHRLSVGLVIGLLLMGLFWTVADYGSLMGRRRAEQIVWWPEYSPNVIVYSQGSLGLEGPGVTQTIVSDPQSIYKYRYTGLRFLIRSDNKYFLLPLSKSRSPSNTIIIPDDDTIRVEISPGVLTP